VSGERRLFREGDRKPSILAFRPSENEIWLDGHGVFGNACDHRRSDVSGIAANKLLVGHRGRVGPTFAMGLV
jgi:hypothetical protein